MNKLCPIQWQELRMKEKILLDGCKRGDLEAVSQLLSKGYEGLNLGEALAWAIDSHSESVVELLWSLVVSSNDDPNVVDAHGIPPISVAVCTGKLRTVKLLLSHPRLDPNKVDQDEIPPLEYAIATKNVPALEQLLEDERVNRIRPEQGGEIYDTALANVRRKRCARLRGLARAIVVLRRLRLQVAMRVYAPGGTGFDAASGALISFCPESASNNVE